MSQSQAGEPTDHPSAPMDIDIDNLPEPIKISQIRLSQILQPMHDSDDANISKSSTKGKGK
jgi:hypothetical protein